MAEKYIRPDPNTLLAQVQAEEAGQARGKLKIFLGYAAGVGKTFAMLEAAHQRQAEGVDVVVGYIETHDHADTETLLAGLEVVPRQQISYAGALLPEMDLDALLARRPDLALVDELAHTNAPGSRHPKRYHDVEELLDAGIDVYTTMNVQHLESLNDVVEQITGVLVREKVPDSVLDKASAIEVVDLPPPELIHRLGEGKVYVPDQAARAVQQFFRIGNLTALRELALRRTAEQVDEQMRSYMQTRAILGPWPAGERLLVCVSASPMSERLVRTARRLADELKAEWFAIYVEEPGRADRATQGADRLARVLNSAEKLGAKVVTLPGADVAETVLNYARQHNITKIIAGKPIQPRWRELWRGSVVDRLIRNSGDIDVYVMSGQEETETPVSRSSSRPRRPWRRYGWSGVLVAATTALCLPLAQFVAPTNLAMFFLVSVVIAAVYLGRGPAILTAAMSVLAFDLAFVEPRLSFTVADTQYLLSFVALFVVGVVISSLAARSREQSDAAQQREAQAVALYELSRDLAAAGDLDEILKVTVRHIDETFDRQAVILLPINQELRPVAQSVGLSLDQNELAVANWTFKQGQPAGRGTDTLPAATARYLPLQTARGVVGVLGVTSADPGSYLAPQERRLLGAFSNQAALAIERANLEEQAHQAQLSQTTEELQRALLHSISHELRTPLVSITGALSTLADDGNGSGSTQVLDAETQHSLIIGAREEAERLNRLVGNLLDMTRIEAGALKTTQEPGDAQEVISAALEQLAGRLENRIVNLTAPSIVAPMDFVLMVHVLVNLLDNALKYSPPGSPIEVEARISGETLEFIVSDRGDGVPPEDLERIFDKFYRVKRPTGTSGTGLGLAICKGIVEAHDGRIWARNRPGGGTTVTVALPLRQGRAKGA